MDLLQYVGLATTPHQAVAAGADYLKENGFKVRGFDLDPNKIEQGKKYLSELEGDRKCDMHTKIPYPIFTSDTGLFTLFTQHQDKPLRSSLSIGFVGDRHPVLFSSFSPFRM